MEYDWIDVTFINADTHKVFVYMSMPADELPATFDHLSTLQIGDQRWSVIQSEPSDAQSYRASGELILVLRKIDVAAPEGVLFGLPSINDFVPDNAGPPADPANMFTLHEDYWQQQEFISAKFQSEIDRELLFIEQIYSEHGVMEKQRYIGFEKVHIRRLIREPLLAGFSLKALEQALPPDHHRYAAILYEDGGIARDGFAFRCGPVVIYGYAPAGIVNLLGLERVENDEVPADLTRSLVSIMRENDFLLVDWRQLLTVRPAGSELKKYMHGYFGVAH
jgi:hypothetical protein